MIILRNIVVGFLFVSICLLNWHCTCNAPKGNTDWTINLSRDNKNPYGLFLASKVMPSLFPESKVEYLASNYDITRLKSRLKNKDNALIVFIGQNFMMTDDEAYQLTNIIKEGKNVFISAYNVSDNFFYQLDLNRNTPSIYVQDASQCIHFNEDNNTRDYCYKGESIMSYFTSSLGDDSDMTPYHTLGATSEKGDNYIVYAIGSGKLFLHASPLVFSNYFLLQNNNQSYLAKLFSNVMKTDNVLWMDFNHRVAERNSSWSILWRDKATRAFLLITLFGILLYVLFSMKRRQKIIPVITPNINSSVAFVETIGRLYYNTGNHNNLAEKMVQHFLEFVRVNYYLPTTLLDDEFEKSLAAKSGMPMDKVAMLVSQIKAVNYGTPTDEGFLFSLHANIQEFYTNK